MSARRAPVRHVSVLLVLYRAFVGNVEHGVDATNARAESNERAELDDFSVAEVGAHAIEEFVAHLGVG